MYLTDDMDCTGVDGPIVRGGNSVRLDLRGHTLTTDWETVVTGNYIVVRSSQGVGRLQRPGDCANFGDAAVANLYNRVKRRDRLGRRTTAPKSRAKGSRPWR